MSLSSRRAWIEIQMWQSRSPSLTVALLTESVDWNFKNLDCKSVIIKVALLTESVDWNFINALHIWHNIWSLSSRRAWIEISGAKALAKGYMSRSPRGECGLKYLFYIIENFSIYVALLAESVDWNIVSKSIICIGFCRSPRGERGLKSKQHINNSNFPLSLSSRRAWIEIVLYTLWYL